MNNKGFSLLEMMVGIGILGVNLLVLNQLQDTATKSKVNNENLRAIAEKGREIEKVLNSPELCNSNFAGRSTNSAVTDLSLDGKVFSKKLNNKINIKEYQIISGAEGTAFLQVTYENSLPSKGGGSMSEIRRRYPINARMDASGTLQDCHVGEGLEDRDLVTENLVCQRVSGVMDANTSQCNIFEKDLEAKVPKGVKASPRGGSFKIVYENGEQKIKHTPCTVKKRLIPNLSGCRKGKAVNIEDFIEDVDDGMVGTGNVKGVGYINICAYRSYCAEDPASPTFGKTYFQIGKIKASGNDTGTMKNCEKKRLPCEGAELSTSSVGGLTQAQSLQAKASLALAKDHIWQMKKLIYQGNLDQAYGFFGDLKKEADKAALAAYRARENATQYPGSETKKAAAQAEKYSRDTKKEFEKGAKLLEDSGAFRGLSFEQ